MPRTRSLAWAELKFGMIAVFALVMAAILIFAVGGAGGFFWQNYKLKAIFMDVAGIKAGSPVRVAGVGVGSVNGVAFVNGGVEVTFSVKDEMKPLVTDQSTASIGSISLLGEGAVDITASPQGTPLKEWSYVKTQLAPGSIAQLTAEATNGLNEAHKLIEDLRNGRGTMGKLFTDDAVYRDLDSFVKAAERVTNTINDGKGTMGKLANDPQLYNEMHESIANLNAITARINAGEGSLGQLLKDPALAKSLTATTANLDSITAKLNSGTGTAGKLLSDDALYKRMDSMTERLDTLVKALNDGQGTAGQLLHDKQLYENMNQTVAEFRSLIEAIKKDPQKYLNVKVSIF
jgi:phospholipid/cholesterol/gamma-HCH transport system substrate-binding protein